MSFTELMSSGRGPGVIGLLMGLVVLLGFGLLFMFAFDESLQGGGQTIESVIAGQTNEIKGYQSRIADGLNQLAKAPVRIAESKDLSALKRQQQAASDRIVALNLSIEVGKKGVASKMEEFENYKDRYRALVRGRAQGETMLLLETRSGAVYKNVNIREVTPVGIQIRHDDGHKRIPFEELPEAIIDFYQFDPNQKSEALVVEKATREEHEAAAAVANAAYEQAAAKQRQKARGEEREKMRASIAKKESQIAVIEGQIHSLEGDMARAESEAAAARAAGRMHLNKSSNFAGNIRSKRNRIASLQTEINQLQASLRN
jgi:chromosome segregation ATPase